MTAEERLADLRGILVRSIEAVENGNVPASVQLVSNAVDVIDHWIKTKQFDGPLKS
jgi:hypothetical protein